MAAPGANLAWETLFDLSATRPGALHRRLAEAIRTVIRAGRVPHGAALPPSRVLAADLHLSRWTVTQAYGQLITEGYLTGKTGSATRVCWSPEPDDRRVLPRPAAAHPHHHTPARYDLSQCAPDYRGFARRTWVESIRAVAETAPFDRLGYAEPGGELRLRETLAEHLDRRRGTRVDPSLMSIFAGARQSLAALARAMVEDGHRRLAVEDPGSPGLWDAARAAGLELVGLPVDAQGVVVEALEAYPDVHAVCIGPAHQIANGAVLSAGRRRGLLAWAVRVGGLVIEDDYDSEFSYDGPAPPAMQGRDPDHVALLGSMSRTMTPSVNVGWIVAPRRWVDSIRSEPHLAATAPALNQLALAHFLESGAYDRHLRSSRQRFRARRNALIAELRRLMPDARISGEQSGLHFLLELPQGAAAGRVVAAAPGRGIELCDVNLLRMSPPNDERHIQVGYSNLPDSLVTEAVGVLVELIEAAMSSGSVPGV